MLTVTQRPYCREGEPTPANRVIPVACPQLTSSESARPLNADTRVRDPYVAAAPPPNRTSCDVSTVLLLMACDAFHASSTGLAFPAVNPLACGLQQPGSGHTVTANGHGLQP